VNRFALLLLARNLKPDLSNDEIVSLLFETGIIFGVNKKLINPTAFINKIEN